VREQVREAIEGPLWPVDMLKAIVDTSTNALDKLEMIAFKPRTISIPTGDIPTLDFASPKPRRKSSTTLAIRLRRRSSTPSLTGATRTA
jgi:hypothetical protein